MESDVVGASVWLGQGWRIVKWACASGCGLAQGGLSDGREQSNLWSRIRESSSDSVPGWNAGDCPISLVGKILWRRLVTYPVTMPGKSQDESCGCYPWGRKELDMTTTSLHLEKAFNQMSPKMNCKKTSAPATLKSERSWWSWRWSSGKEKCWGTLGR